MCTAVLMCYSTIVTMTFAVQFFIFFPQRLNYVKFMGALGSSHRHVKMSAWTSHSWLMLHESRGWARCHVLRWPFTHRTSSALPANKTHGCRSRPINSARSRPKCLLHRGGDDAFRHSLIQLPAPSDDRTGQVMSVTDLGSLKVINLFVFADLMPVMTRWGELKAS